jgi:hypothetical protein
MSTATNKFSNQSQRTTIYDIQKTFIYDNRFEIGTLNNNTGGALTFEEGTVLGRLAANGKYVPFNEGGADGSENIVGVLKGQVEALADGADAQVSVGIFGDVSEEKLIFINGETLDGSTVGTRTVRDLMKATGLNPIAGIENTKEDN